MSAISLHQMPIVTTFEAPPGTEAERIVGPCWGITVRSRSVVGTACAGCQQVFGGEITMLTELAGESRNEAMNRLERHAKELPGPGPARARLQPPREPLDRAGRLIG